MRAFRIGCSYIPLPRHRHQFPLWMMEVWCSTDADVDRREPAAEGRWPGRWLQERLLGKHVCAGGIICQHGGWWGWVVARHPPPVLGWVVEADFTWPFREPRMMCGSRETWMYRRSVDVQNASQRAPLWLPASCLSAGEAGTKKQEDCWHPQKLAWALRCPYPYIGKWNSLPCAGSCTLQISGSGSFS